MIIQHNLAAMNSRRTLGITKGKQAKSSEKLSSGYKINRAADDAAGLSISEKMRKQIKGLDQASNNAQDGISAVQTAEGALSEVHSMLHRMNELAVQAANGTNSESDREAIQAEIEQLTTEIDRVAETTKFNETYLLKGDTDGTTVTQNVNAHDAGIAGDLVDNGDGTYTFTLAEDLKDGDKISIAGAEYTIGNPKTDIDYIQKGTTNADAVTLGIGDSVTYKGNTTTVVNKITLSSATEANNAAGWADGDCFRDSNGVTWLVVNNNGTTDDTVEGMVSGKVKISDIASKLDAGSVIIRNKAKSWGNMEVVNALENGEYSVAETDRKVSAIISNGNSLIEGDTITINGQTQTVTDEQAKVFSEIKNAINGLGEGSVVTIGTTEYKVVGNDSEVDTNATQKKLTREDIISLIKEYDEVKIANYPNGNTATLTVYGVSGTQKEGRTSTDDVYKLIAEELKKASSIGSDTEASVTINNDGSFTIKQATVEVKKQLSFTLHAGADADMSNKVMVDIERMDAAGLGIKGIDVVDKTGMKATYATDAIADAVAKVSGQRASLGAIQNRLEAAISNLDNVSENTTAAESRIRDTDMAEEMVEYSKNMILAQAGQSMLAQSNQSTQGVLQLLQ